MKKFTDLLVFVFIICSFSINGIIKAESAAMQEDGLYATLNTNKGDIIIKFDYKIIPLTVCNFVGLAEGTINNSQSGPGVPYFDGCKFHRVVFDRVIQSGDPTGTGSGGPGYQFQNEIDPSLIHDRRGIVGMANAGAHTNGSQFYVTHLALPELDGKYTIFGHVDDSASLEVVMAVRQGDFLNTVTITRVGDDAQAFNTDQDAFDSLKLWVTEKKQNSTEKSCIDPIQVMARRGIVSCKFMKPGITAIDIYCLNGRKLFSLPSVKASKNIYTVPYCFRPGMYIINIRRGKTISTYKLVVQVY